MNYNKCINTTLPFYSIQIIYPFPDLKISANYDKVEGHLDNGKALLIGLKLYCKISLYYLSTFYYLPETINNQLFSIL